MYRSWDQILTCNSALTVGEKFVEDMTLLKSTVQENKILKKRSDKQVE